MKFHITGTFRFFVTVAAALLLNACANLRVPTDEVAQKPLEAGVVSQLFADAGVTGTMVISPLHAGPTWAHDVPRANRRMAPASTFKILNTLVALEEGVIRVDDTLRWDGQIREMAWWNQDQTLSNAFRGSCVWCYQLLAQRVGAAAYTKHLEASGYGELHQPFNVTTFWLDGGVQISALEQVAFLKRVYRRTLPFKAASYDALAQMMVIEQNSVYTLRAKTGWATRGVTPVGWYVGYVETAKGTWFFAMNMDAADQKALALRQALTLKALRAVGVL